MSNAYRKGLDLAGDNKNEAALIAFQAALDQEPTNFKAAFGIGLMHQRQQRHEDAIEAFSKVLEIQPRIPEAHYSRALSLQACARHAEALPDLDTALDLDPGYMDALYARGLSLKNLERYEEALEAFHVVLGKTGAYLPASHGRATLLHMRGEYPGAISDFSDCIRGGMDNFNIRLLRGLAYYRSGNLAAALEDLSTAIEMNPENGRAYIHRWQVLTDLGEKEAAKKDLEFGRQLLNSGRTDPAT